jgi:hypothetical protein
VRDRKYACGEEVGHVCMCAKVVTPAVNAEAVSTENGYQLPPGRQRDTSEERAITARRADSTQSAMIGNEAWRQIDGFKVCILESDCFLDD